MTFDPSKPLQTRDGSIKWDKDGRAIFTTLPSGPAWLDLINVPEPRVYWLRLNNNPWAATQDASKIHSGIPHATHKITICEGCEPKIEEVK